MWIPRKTDASLTQLVLHVTNSIGDGVHGLQPIVEIDRHLRSGLVSMSHGWGGAPDRDAEVHRLGGNTNRLASTDAAWDRYTGIPTMSNLPVDVIAPRDPVD